MLYCITIGPTRLLWSFFTRYDGAWIELMPIFDSADAADRVITQMAEKHSQIASIYWLRVQELIEGRSLRFIFNLKATNHYGEIYLQESDYWGLSIEQVGELIGVNPKQR
jgi:hypothetical protein